MLSRRSKVRELPVAIYAKAEVVVLAIIAVSY
jgi:hypothetical protein